MSNAPDLKASALAHVSRFMDAVFQAYQDGRTEALRAACSADITVFGTAAHEKVCGIEEYARLMPVTPEAFVEDASWRFITAEPFIEERVCWVWGDVTARLKTGGAWIDMPPFRMTWILRRTDAGGGLEASWEVVHGHFSFPDQQKSDEYFDMDTLQAHSRMLELKVAERTAELERSLEELRRMQQQLVQQEKLASLGALTAGIAHEIKNPLNFVNNFAQLSRDLVREIEAEHAENPDLRVADVADVLSDLGANVTRIEEHGRRADGIVRSMLAHSRGGRGTREVVALNPLVDEYVNLSFHGARAQRPGLNANVERSLDAAAGSVEAVPEDVGRVLLNLVSNALYAVHQRHERGETPEGYAPLVRVSTHAAAGAVEVQVWDNGGGIPEAVQARIFEPFFTTKPTGEGTGLGLSLSHDIVAAHGGTLHLETEAGDWTRFTVRLPIEQTSHRTALKGLGDL